MPRKNTIRWRKSDDEELKRVVRNFNAKISRILKKDPTLATYLPKRIKIADIKQNIETRQDFNKTVKSLKRFLVRGAENPVTSKGGIRTTQWEKKEIGIQVATINRRRTVKRKFLEELEATSRGEALNMTRRQMNSIRMNELKPKTYNFDKISKYDWERYKQNVQRQARSNFQNEADLSLRRNYIKGLYDVFGNTDETNELVKRIEEMNINDFIEQFYREQEATVDFIYDPLEAGRKLEILMEDVWTGEPIKQVDSFNDGPVIKAGKKYKKKKQPKKKKVKNTGPVRNGNPIKEFK